MNRTGNSAFVAVLLALIVVVLMIVLLISGRGDFEGTTETILQDVQCQLAQGVCVAECPDGAEITSVTGDPLCRTGGVCCDPESVDESSGVAGEAGESTGETQEQAIDSHTVTWLPLANTNVNNNDREALRSLAQRNPPSDEHVFVFSASAVQQSQLQPPRNALDTEGTRARNVRNAFLFYYRQAHNQDPDIRFETGDERVVSIRVVPRATTGQDGEGWGTGMVDGLPNYIQSSQAIMVIPDGT